MNNCTIISDSNNIDKNKWSEFAYEYLYRDAITILCPSIDNVY